MKRISVILLVPLALLLFACTASQEMIDTAVQQTVAAQTPVIQTVKQTVGVESLVTVEVPVTQEVTREVEVEVEREVTRIVEVVITATPLPTETPAPTNTPAPPSLSPTSPPPNASASLLQSMQTARSNIESFGGLIDVALGQGYINCQDVVNMYDGIALAPTYDVSGEGDTVQWAYNTYRSAIQTFASGASGIVQNCRDFLANPSGGGIPFQQWGAARQNVNNALEILIPAINALESQ